LEREFDVGEFVSSKREIVVFECPLSVASDVVKTVLADPAFRRLSIGFVGYDNSKAPVVAIDVEFAVKLA
jgi:hypothetical protein